MLVPDVAVKTDNIRHGPGIGQIPPLIAIEVASPSDTRVEMQSKTGFYLDGGVREVWIVWPKSHTVDVWTAPNTSIVFTDQQDITSAHLPGWSCPVREFFEG